LKDGFKEGIFIATKNYIIGKREEFYTQLSRLDQDDEKFMDKV
jgi:hypothetical protein